MADDNAAPTGIDLLRQRYDTLRASAVDAESTMQANVDPATVLVDPIDYPAAALAWSDTDYTAVSPAAPEHDDEPDADDAPSRDDGRRPLPRSLMVLLIAVVVSGAALAAFVIGGREAAPAPERELSPTAVVAAPPAPQYPVPAPAAAPEPPAVPPVSHDPADKYTAPAVKTTPDQDFDWLVRNGSVDVPISDDLGHNAGRALCRWISQSPRTDDDVYYHLQDVFPGLTAAQLGTFSGAAKEAYCPQYRHLPD